MKYTDNHKKFVCVLNRNADRGVLQNSSLHAMIGLVAKMERMGALAQTEMLDYDQCAGLPAVLLSRFPVIALRAKNSSQLNALRDKAEAVPNVVVNYFTDAMNADSAEAQMERTRTTPIEQQEFFAVVLFGDAEVLAQLTRKFSIYTDPPAPALAGASTDISLQPCVQQ